MNNAPVAQTYTLRLFLPGVCPSCCIITECVWDLFDLVRWPSGLHGSRLLSAGNLSHHLSVRWLAGPPGHHPGDTDVLYTEQPADFLRPGALPGGQRQHPHHPWCQPLRRQVSDSCFSLQTPRSATSCRTNLFSPVMCQFENEFSFSECSTLILLYTLISIRLNSDSVWICIMANICFKQWHFSCKQISISGFYYLCRPVQLRCQGYLTANGRKRRKNPKLICLRYWQLRLK